MGLGPLAALSVGCGQAPAATEPVVAVTSALSVAGARVLGFESPLADWTASGGTRSSSTTRVEGSFSLGITGTGSTTLTSVPIDSLTTVGDTATIDLFVPTQQSGASFGTLQLFIDLPSRGLNNNFIAQRELVGLPLGRFNRLAFALPASVRTALQTSYTDLRVRFVLNAPNNGGTWLFDRVSFDVVPPNSPTPSIEQRLVALEGQVTTLQGQVTSLQSANSALTTRVGTLETALQESNGRITTLETSNAALTANVATLTTNLSQLATEVDTLGLQVAANAVGLSSLGAQMAAFQIETTARLNSLESVTLPAALVAELQSITQYLSFETIDTHPSLVVSGANVYVRDGSGSTQCTTCNGLGNLIIGYNEQNSLSGPVERTGSHNLIAGAGHEWTSYGGFVAGFENHLLGSYGSIAGGRANYSRAFVATVAGGVQNEANENFSHVTGGVRNIASGSWSVVVGGESNEATVEASVAVAGWENRATGSHSSVLGGSSNVSSGTTASVVGGSFNEATANGAAVLSGQYNIASAEDAAVLGGRINEAAGVASAVCGGGSNNANSTYSTIGGGLNRDIAAGSDYSWRAGSQFENQ